MRALTCTFFLLLAVTGGCGGGGSDDSSSSTTSSSTASSSGASSSASSSANSSSTSSSSSSTSSSSSSEASGTQTLSYMVIDSVALQSATQTYSGSDYSLVLGDTTVSYTVGSTLGDPTSPSGYFWIGTNSDGTAAPLGSVPVARLCTSTENEGYILIASGVTQVTDASEIYGKTFYRRDCGFSTATAQSNYFVFNTDGSAYSVEDGENSTMSATEISQILADSSYTNTYSSSTEYGFVRVYKATINGSTRYFLLDSGYEKNTSGDITDDWIDMWIDSSF